MSWSKLSHRILQGGAIDRDEALAVLASDDNELLGVLAAASTIRLHHFGRNVSLHVIRNAKSGSCTENCSFCSQSISSKSDIQGYPLISREVLLSGAQRAFEMNAKRYCIVTSGRSPSDKELDFICNAVAEIKRKVPIQICTSLGILTEAQARRLKSAGVDRYNHNLESSERFFDSVCTTHSYSDRHKTAKTAKGVGLELCSGGLIGVGEDPADRVALAFELRDLGADSVPLNFLDPRPGTSLGNLEKLSPGDCLRALSMFRFVLPEKEIRIAGGREVCLGHLQVLSLYVADSMFTNGYLTTPGQGYESDLAMIAQAGFRVSEYIA
jgi:biotin synthase